jgi:hypothetical protein
LRYYDGNFLQNSRKAIKNLIHYSRSLGRNLQRGVPNHEHEEATKCSAYPCYCSLEREFSPKREREWNCQRIYDAINDVLH